MRNVEQHIPFGRIKSVLSGAECTTMRQHQSGWSAAAFGHPRTAAVSTARSTQDQIRADHYLIIPSSLIPVS